MWSLNWFVSCILDLLKERSRSRRPPFLKWWKGTPEVLPTDLIARSSPRIFSQDSPVSNTVERQWVRREANRSSRSFQKRRTKWFSGGIHWSLWKFYRGGGWAFLKKTTIKSVERHIGDLKKVLCKSRHLSWWVWLGMGRFTFSGKMSEPILREKTCDMISPGFLGSLQDFKSSMLPDATATTCSSPRYKLNKNGQYPRWFKVTIWSPIVGGHFSIHLAIEMVT